MSDVMGVQQTGLTLEGLAHKLEALQRENAQNARRLETLERENAELRREVTAPRGSGLRRDKEIVAESGVPVSRRWLLSKAGAAAVGVAAAGALMLREPRRAKAHHLGDMDPSIFPEEVLTHYVDANSDDQSTAILGRTASSGASAVFGINAGTGPGVGGSNDGPGPAVEGTAYGSGGTGVKGTGRYGVWGESDQAGFYGVFGRNNLTDGTGVRGVGAKTGVLGESRNGMGVKGTSSAANLGAVEGHNDGGGAGVSGVGKVGMLAFSHTNGWIASWGRHTANGYGVAGDSAQGVGVSGESTGGYGGLFGGGKAQLRLKPASTAGKPTSGSHSIGEIYMDSRATLFVCVADGSPGTWKKLAFATTTA